MTTIQSELAKLWVAQLRPRFAVRGFKKSGNSYWRQSNGMSHTVAFPMPPVNPPSPHDESYELHPWHGTISLAIGAALIDGERFAVEGKPTSVSACDMFADATSLLASKDHVHWHLSDFENANAGVDSLLPIIDTWFGDRSRLDAVEKLALKFPTSLGISRWRLVISHHGRNQRDLAQKMLDMHTATAQLNKRHAYIVASFAAENGYWIRPEFLDDIREALSERPASPPP